MILPEIRSVRVPLDVPALLAEASHREFPSRGELQLGHLAFEVKDFPELVRASALLVRNGFPLDWGPARHTIGHNRACYHRNPDGIRTELYAEMDKMLDEELGYFDPKSWHEDRPQRPRNWEYEDSPRNKWIPGVP